METLGRKIEEVEDQNRVPYSSEVLDEVEEEIRERLNGPSKFSYSPKVRKFRLKWGEDYLTNISKR